eukprot:TRINITY_DN22_c0_g1_i1.p1 TRINITY_DN22_c0_g1~~TRINITY_DN22_c0_g1_i1.p1  ORF type:complete len:258 (-),score=51.96 TRINITY_DN22_c0_g1_i1:172-945(-)
MIILNQTITPHGGQPAFPSKGSKSQEMPQHLPMAPSFLHRSHSFKSFQSTPLKKTPLTNASGGSSSTWEESICRNTDELDIKIQRRNGILEPVSGTFKFPQLLGNEEGQYDNLTQPISQIKQGDTNKTMGNEAEFEPFTLSFLRSIMEKDKMNMIRDVMAAELDLLSTERNNTLVVAVSSAVKLERKQMDQIARKMQRVTGIENVRLENTVDPSLIAGFVISYEKEGAQVIDLSVKGQLANLVARIESTDQRIANGQ